MLMACAPRRWRYRGLLHHVARGAQGGIDSRAARGRHSGDVDPPVPARRGLRRPEGQVVLAGDDTAIREALQRCADVPRASGWSRPCPTPRPISIEWTARSTCIWPPPGCARSSRNWPCREQRLLEQLASHEQPSYAEIALRLRMPIVVPSARFASAALRRLAPLLAGSWT